jgi:hypothetical protein
VRSGLHTGEVERSTDDVAGLAVHLAARIMSVADAGEILASRTVRDLVIGSELTFADRGEHELKGIPDRWALYAVVYRRDALRPRRPRTVTDEQVQEAIIKALETDEARPSRTRRRRPKPCRKGCPQLGRSGPHQPDRTRRSPPQLHRNRAPTRQS